MIIIRWSTVTWFLVVVSSHVKIELIYEVQLTSEHPDLGAGGPD